MLKRPVTLLGKAIRTAARLKGGGSAFPGLVVEKLNPNFIKDTLSSLPYGVVIVSGTNGKTTTTKMVVELLEGQGLKVFTNRTGSNFTRGVAAALLGDVDLRGRLHADIAVLELDEAHAVHFVRAIPPDFSLILNVMRDQLDRFGEIDTTAKLLGTIAQATKNTVVLNREDERIVALRNSLVTQRVHYFGLSDALLSTFPSDDNLHGGNSRSATIDADVVLESFSNQQATFTYGGESVTTTLRLNGIYNVYNAAAALSLVRTILGEKLQNDQLVKTLATITPAFGRGESFVVNGQPLELVLVKNPAGFRLGLQSFDPTGYSTMIAINDNYADGRDMSWLWDVNFESLRHTGVEQVSGVRAYDMALRLQYDTVPIAEVLPDVPRAFNQFLRDNPDRPKRIYCTYTAMLALRQLISKHTIVEKIG